LSPKDTAGGRIGISEVVDRNPRSADTGADERRHAPPGAQIDIGVAENDPFRLGGVIGVDAERRPRVGKVIRSKELRIAAILTGDVGTEPVVDLVTDAEAEDARGAEAVVLNRCGVADGVEHVVQTLHALIAEADVASQIPAAEFLDRGRCVHGRRRRDGHVGCKRPRRQQRCRSGGNKRLNATHWLRPFVR